ncbi:hypothetical protein [Parvibaculum sp.]|jgi:hypothetical protein|uniref:hypothetical protein n=1 Tax=Parvibaculum sp. TaxID=2024848 RepID=UPI000C919B25|nr:hypothetical protein [Parvibaculum sp.]MAB14801.1 hypothetical protein [Parvibaculum sp.]
MTDEISIPPGATVTARYSREKGQTIVYGGLLIGVGLVLLATPRIGHTALFLAAISFAVAAFHWPFVARNNEALKIGPAGIEIAGLGRFPWPDIKDVAVHDSFVRNIRNAELRITLSRAVAEAVVPPENAQAVWRQYMYKCWRQVGSNGVRVKLNILNLSPEMVAKAIERYCSIDIPTPPEEPGVGV